MINEWNGYWRFDRTNKFTGLEELMPGMTLNDFHAVVYLSTGNEICNTVKSGETLVSISRKVYGTQKLVQRIKKANALSDENQIYPGQKLIIPGTLR